MKTLIFFLLAAALFTSSCTKEQVIIVQPSTPTIEYVTSWESQVQNYFYDLEATNAPGHFADLTAGEAKILVTINTDGTFSYQVPFNVGRLDTDPTSTQILKFTILDASTKKYNEVQYIIKSVDSNGNSTAVCKYERVKYLPSEQFVTIDGVQYATGYCTFFYSK